jgi:diguanylate cyclase (GGDEF)-like protein
VALIDVDHFGSVNKRFGWTVGDLAWRQVADLVRRNVREGDWVARYGGEELAVVLPDVSCHAATQVLERIRQVVAGEALRGPRGEAFSVSVSVGGVELQPGEALEALWVRLSDKLLEAKNGGRNQVRA